MRAPSIRPHRAAALLAFAVLSSTASGRPALGTEAPPDDLLRGPSVADATRPTLLASDMEGRFRKVEGRPEAAAMALLPLDPETRDAADALFAARLESIRQHVLDEIDLLAASSDAVRAGDRKEAQRLQRELIARLEGWDARTPMLEPLAAVLAPEEHAALARMLDEYWTAWIASESRGGRRDPAEVEARLAEQLLQAELSVVYDATLRPLQRKLERIYEIAEVDEVQRARIRETVLAHLRETRLDPDEAARLDFAAKVMEVLDDRQRLRIFSAALNAL